MTETENPRVALITGGSRGIGLATAHALLSDGWRVHLCSRSQAKVDEALTDLSERFGDRASGEAVDVRDEGQVKSLVERLVERTGRLDCLVNNAGLGVFGPVDALTGDQWRQVIDTNLTGAFYVLQAAAQPMMARGSGWIFNVASLASKNPFAGGAAYNASKFGLLGLSEAAMLDLRHHGVRVAAILPGSVDTDFRPPSRRPDTDWMLQPEDVAQVVLDLLRFPQRALPSRIEIRPSQPPRS